MYLSRLILNPRSRAVYRDLTDCHDMHRTITNAFPPLLSVAGGPRAESGVLFRVETSGMRPGPPGVLVLSRLEPRWDHLAPDYLLADLPENPECKNITAAYARIGAGQALRFRLLANPTKRLSAHSHGGAERSPGKRAQLFREEEQIAWLRRKGEQSGFRLLDLRLRNAATGGTAAIADVRAGATRRVDGWRERGQEGRIDRLTFGAVLFEGMLEVTDAARFREALRDGIGSGKAYGFGLLSIARPLSGVEDVHEMSR